MKSYLERDFLRFGLVIGIAFLVFQTAESIWPVYIPQTAGVTIIMLILFVFFLVQLQRDKWVPWIGVLLHAVVLTGFGFFWVNYGGLAGTVPSFLCAYVCFVVIASHGWFLVAALMMLVLQMVAFFFYYRLFGMTSFHDVTHTDIRQQTIDYLLIVVILVSFLLYLKQKFSFYRQRVAKRFHQLNQSMNILYSQNMELATREEETRSINENLETIVEERLNEIELKNKSLAEYAFINAHMLRAPLCRILGLLNLMEREPNVYSPEQIKAMRMLADRIDSEIKQISKVIG
ncbi:MAG: hypothetical protein ACKOE6_12060 [Flammeovirgaceae bacterium]